MFQENVVSMYCEDPGEVSDPRDAEISQLMQTDTKNIVFRENCLSGVTDCSGQYFRFNVNKCCSIMHSNAFLGKGFL